LSTPSFIGANHRERTRKDSVKGLCAAAISRVRRQRQGHSGPVARKGVLAVSLGLLLSLAAGAAARPAESTRLSDLRVCTSERFSRAAERCLADERRSSLESKLFACSVSVELARAAPVHAVIAYRGRTAYEYTTRKLPTGTYRWWIGLELGEVPLPGGPWICRFGAGSAVAGARFASAGPTAALVGSAICAGGDTRTLERPVRRVCRADAPARITATDELFCNAYFGNAVGKQVTIRLLRRGATLGAPHHGTITEPLWVEAAGWNVDGRREPFAAGDYACRFTVDGKQLAERRLQISGP
jgi:hypothetical protein